MVEMRNKFEQVFFLKYTDFTMAGQEVGKYIARTKLEI